MSRRDGDQVEWLLEDNGYTREDQQDKSIADHVDEFGDSLDDLFAAPVLPSRSAFSEALLSVYASNKAGPIEAYARKALAMIGIVSTAYHVGKASAAVFLPTPRATAINTVRTAVRTVTL